MEVQMTVNVGFLDRAIRIVIGALVSPIRPAEFILGKTVLFFVVGMGSPDSSPSPACSGFRSRSSAIPSSSYWHDALYAELHHPAEGI
jgi:hypothetical protein